MERRDLSMKTLNILPEGLALRLLYFSEKDYEDRLKDPSEILSEMKKKDLYTLAFSKGYEDCWRMYSSEDIPQDDLSERDKLENKDIADEAYIRNIDKLESLDNRDSYIYGYLHGFELSYNNFSGDEKGILISYQDRDKNPSAEEQKRFHDWYENYKNTNR